MSLRLRALEVHVPAWAARSVVRRLSKATASAFGRELRDVRRLDQRTLLARYASFTAECAERALADGADLEGISRRMWSTAHALGRSLRRLLGVRTRPEALRAARIAYDVIGIGFRADDHGVVTVDRCAFAGWYSPPVCRLMSSLDSGLIAGLTDGGRMAFSERITEGRPRCLARITWQPGQP